MIITAPNDPWLLWLCMCMCLVVVSGGRVCWLCFFLILRCVNGARPRRSLALISTFLVIVGVLPISSGGMSVACWLPASGALSPVFCWGLEVELLSSALTYCLCLQCLVTLLALKRSLFLLFCIFLKDHLPFPPLFKHNTHFLLEVNWLCDPCTSHPATKWIWNILLLRLCYICFSNVSINTSAFDKPLLESIKTF